MRSTNNSGNRPLRREETIRRIESNRGSGGIVGCSTAYFLVRQQGRSPVELPLMIRSLRLCQELSRDLGGDLGFVQGGSLYLAERPGQLAELADWLPVAREHGLETRLLSVAELGAGSQSSPT